MLIDLAMTDTLGGNPSNARISLDFTMKQWFVETGIGMTKIGFNRMGSFEIKTSELWLCDQNTSSLGNKLILKNPPTGETDEARSKGTGDLTNTLMSRFSGGKLNWSVSTLAPIRKEILRLLRTLLPGIGTFLPPGRYPLSATEPGSPGETNCYILPGWIGERLGGNISQVVRENLPSKTSKTGYAMQDVTVNINKGSMSLEKFARQLDAKFNQSAKKLWNEYKPASDNRPLPGDFYVLEKEYKKLQITAHVGVIVDASGDTWRTADSGQSPPIAIPTDPTTKKPLYAKGFSAGYRDRNFNKLTGEIVGEDKQVTKIKGWIDIDHPLLFPTWATKPTV